MWASAGSLLRAPGPPKRSRGGPPRNASASPGMHDACLQVAFAKLGARGRDRGAPPLGPPTPALTAAGGAPSTPTRGPRAGPGAQAQADAEARAPTVDVAQRQLVAQLRERVHALQRAQLAARVHRPLAVPPRASRAPRRAAGSRARLAGGGAAAPGPALAAAANRRHLRAARPGREGGRGGATAGPRPRPRPPRPRPPRSSVGPGARRPIGARGGAWGDGASAISSSHLHAGPRPRAARQPIGGGLARPQSRSAAPPSLSPAGLLLLPLPRS